MVEAFLPIPIPKPRNWVLASNDSSLPWRQPKGGGYKVSGGCMYVGISVVNALSSIEVTVYETSGLHWRFEQPATELSQSLPTKKPELNLLSYLKP